MFLVRDEGFKTDLYSDDSVSKALSTFLYYPKDYLLITYRLYRKEESKRKRRDRTRGRKLEASRQFLYFPRARRS